MELLVSLWSFVISPLLLLVSSFLSFLLFLQVRNWYRYRTSGCNIPQLPEKPFLGSFRLEQLHENHIHHLKTCGPVAYSTVFHLQKIVVADPDVAQIVLQKQAFPKSAIFSGISDFWGVNLLSMTFHGEGSQWRTERSLVNPAFKLSSLRSLHPVFSDLSIDFTKHFLRTLSTPSSPSIDLPFEVAKLTLNILSTAGFSYSLGGGDGDLSSSSFREEFIISLQEIVESTGNPLLVMPFGGKLLRRYHAKALKVIDDVIYGVIDERIKEQQQQGGAAARKPDLLDMMLRADDEGRQLSRESVRNELLLFYLAGHETSANAISWALFRLCSHPQVEAKVMDEIAEVMGPVKEGVVDAPSLEQIDQMIYLEMVLNETLRLHPPVPFVPREVPSTFEHKGHVYPEGAMIELSPFLIQRDPALWENPEEFIPERFSKENSSGRHPYSFFPFSGGPRICIGRNFFLQEAKITLATLLRQISFTLDHSKPNNGKICTAAVAMKPLAVWVHSKKRIH